MVDDLCRRATAKSNSRTEPEPAGQRSRSAGLQGLLLACLDFRSSKAESWTLMSVLSSQLQGGRGQKVGKEKSCILN